MSWCSARYCVFCIRFFDGLLSTRFHFRFGYCSFIPAVHNLHSAIVCAALRCILLVIYLYIYIYMFIIVSACNLRWYPLGIRSFMHFRESSCLLRSRIVCCLPLILPSTNDLLLSFNVDFLLPGRCRHSPFVTFLSRSLV